jgi:hypothetical protein
MEEKEEEQIQIYLRLEFRLKNGIIYSCWKKRNMKTGIGICQCEAGNTVGETKIAQPAFSSDGIVYSKAQV